MCVCIKKVRVLRCRSGCTDNVGALIVRVGFGGIGGLLAKPYSNY